MVSKCANPKCSAVFRYLREGRLFNFELSVKDAHSNGRPAIRRPEYYWLCSKCALTFTVAADNGSVYVRPLAKAVAKAAASSSASSRRIA